MVDYPYDIHHLTRVGGHSALDFCNTADREEGRVIAEALKDYSDGITGVYRLGWLTEAQAVQLHARAQTHPSAAHHRYVDLIALREAMARVFAAIARGMPIVPQDLERLVSFQRAGGAYRHTQLSDGFGWVWDMPEGEHGLALPSWVAAHSAGELLAAQPAPIRQCDGVACGWLFLDTSRNGKRRWCDMRDCGNRAKAKRHYQRNRPTPPANDAANDHAH
jgi:predicted RNA-binding Zn ribbon-like protein